MNGRIFICVHLCPSVVSRLLGCGRTCSKCFYHADEPSPVTRVRSRNGQHPQSFGARARGEVRLEAARKIHDSGPPGHACGRADWTVSRSPVTVVLSSHRGSCTNSPNSAPTTQGQLPDEANKLGYWPCANRGTNLRLALVLRLPRPLVWRYRLIPRFRLLVCDFELSRVFSISAASAKIAAAGGPPSTPVRLVTGCSIRRRRWQGCLLSPVFCLLSPVFWPPA